MDDEQKVWLFGPLSLVVGSILFALGLPVEIVVSFVGLLGMPTWFCGLLWIGIKSDEFFGIEHGYGYAIQTDDTE